jgi:hypothetical protein
MFKTVPTNIMRYGKGSTQAQRDHADIQTYIASMFSTKTLQRDYFEITLYTSSHARGGRESHPRNVKMVRKGDITWTEHSVSNNL